LSEPALYATLWDYGQLVEAMDARRVELGLSHDEWNERAGLEAGYTSKACGPSQSAKFGHKSLFPAIRQLGLRLVLEIDEHATKTILEGRTPRQNKQARPNHYAKQVGIRTKRRLLAQMGRNGGLKAMSKLTPEQRSERARNAAVIRWADVKAAAAPPAAAPRSAESAGQRHSIEAAAPTRRARRPLACPMV
jgi:hypothetical protein